MTSIQDSQDFLNTKHIGISISDSHELEYLGYGAIHQKDAIVEFSRYLLANKGTLVYGHDLRSDGYAKLIKELTRFYAPRSGLNNSCINYFAWPIHLNLKETHTFEYAELGIDLVKIQLPENEFPDVLPKTFLPPDSPENRVVWARSLTHMRKVMNEKTDARIFMGGQIKANKWGERVNGYKGLMPGVLEEGLVALHDDRQLPLYFMGAFGGASKAMIEAVKGNEPKELTEQYQVEHYPDYAEFLQLYRTKYCDNSIDYKAINEDFKKLGIKGLSKRNGLTEEENERLFETPHISEMVRLVLKGLATVYQSK